MAEVFDVAVVGAGPAGVAAACRVAERGARVALVDEGFRPGGQIYRHREGRAPAAIGEWMARLARLKVDVIRRTAVYDALRLDGKFQLRTESVHLEARKIVLATGARELLLPFPGWTLPNVFSAGGLQALVKSGLEVAGKPVVIGGSGPLLLPVAATLAKAGAKVELVCEQASRASLARALPWLARSPRKLVEALRYQAAFGPSRYRTSTWITEANGTDRLEAVVTNSARRVSCEFAGVSFGLVPNVELAVLLGCELRGGFVVVDRRQQSTVPGVFVAGEPCGIAGVDVALGQGLVAGDAACGDATVTADGEAARGWYEDKPPPLLRSFALRHEVLELARADTVVCRCEDVRLSRFDPEWSVREAKLATRAGMGPCQGRICGPALDAILGYGADCVRCPAKPATFESLLIPEDRE